MIGSGLGGLVAGALFAQDGGQVLVLEKNASFGGAVGTFQRGALTIEGSLHEIDGLDEDDPKLPFVEALGLKEHLEFVEVGDLYEVRSSLLGEPFALSAGVDEGVASAIDRFPAHAKGIRDYYERMIKLRSSLSLALRKLDEPLWWVGNTPRLPRLFWPLVRDHRRSLDEVLDRHFGADEAVKVALCANLPYYSDDPKRMWFPLYAAAQASYQLGGGHYVRGGSGRLVEHLVSVIRDAGGDAQAGRRVTRILMDAGRISGVEHEAARADGGGRDIRRESAPVMFGNAAPHVLAEMLPEQHRAAFMEPYARRPVSLSLWVLALGFDRKPTEFGVRCFSTWLVPEWMRSLDEMRQGGQFLGGAPSGRLPYVEFTDYSLIDSGLPGPPYSGNVMGLDLIENWEGLSGAEEHERKERWAEAIIDALDREFPGLGGAVVQHMLLTARESRDYLNTPQGAVYGFAPQPPRRHFFKPRTPIKGLWLASAYGGFGGYSGAILSGAAAVRGARKSMSRPRAGTTSAT